MNRRISSVIAVFLVIMAMTTTSFAEPPWKFIVTCDSRSNSAAENNGVSIQFLSELAAEIIRQDVDFILFGGES